MGRIEEPHLKKEILDKCIKAALKRRSLNLSVHELARIIGVSARMLIYHFGSKAELDDEIVKTLDTRTRLRLEELALEVKERKSSSLVHLWDAATEDQDFLSQAGLTLNPSLYYKKPKLQIEMEKLTQAWLDVIASFVETKQQADLGLLIFQGGVIDAIMTGNVLRTRGSLQLSFSKEK